MTKHTPAAACEHCNGGDFAGHAQYCPNAAAVEITREDLPGSLAQRHALYLRGCASWAATITTSGENNPDFKALREAANILETLDRQHVDLVNTLRLVIANGPESAPGLGAYLNAVALLRDLGEL